MTCFAFFPKKLKELQFLAKYSSSLAVTAWSHHLIIHRSRPTKKPTHEHFFMLQKKIIIPIAATDVVVLAISVVEEIKVEELWVAFGTGKHFRYLSAYAIASSLGAGKSRALPAFHAVTESDTVSFFGWKGNLKARNTWNAFPTVALAFLELGTEKANLSQDAFEKLDQFVVFMYEKNRAVTTVNAARQKLFSQRCKAINTHIYIYIYISTDHQGCHLHPPGDGPRITMEATMDNTSSG